MPVEDQARRVRTPLRRRDRIFLVSLAAAGTAAVVVGLVVHFSRAGSSEGRCVTVTLPSTMGGATIHRCGAAAVRFCREAGPDNAEIAAACRRKGL